MTDKVNSKKLDHKISEESMDNSWKDEFIVLVFSQKYHIINGN